MFTIKVDLTDEDIPRSKEVLDYLELVGEKLNSKIDKEAMYLDLLTYGTCFIEYEESEVKG